MADALLMGGTPNLAFDRSLRSEDLDGHLRVEESRISKANICPYKGSEIPGGQALGLDPNRIYRLLRDPAELARGASTFDGKPLLIRHVPVSSQDPSQDLCVGAVGVCTFEPPYLVTRPLTVWTDEAKRLIESGAQRELSAAYRYEAEMVPGIYGAEPYDGRMVNIQGNHVAIVSEGRAGPDVHVADELPEDLRPMKHAKTALLVAALAAAGATLNDAQALAMDAALLAADKKAKDEDMTDEEKKAAEDAYRADCSMDASKELSDEEREEAHERARDKKAKDKKAKDSKAKDSKHGKDGDVDHRKDFDSAKDSISKDELSAAVKAAGDSTRRQMLDLMAAREAVAPVVGKVSMALDSAEEVYAFALKAKGVEIKDVPPAAYRALFDVVAKQPAASEAPAIALDSSGNDLADIDAIFRSRVAA